MNWALAVGHHRARARLPQLVEPRRGLRHRGHRHDDDHDAALLPRRARPLALAAAGGRGRSRSSSSAWTSSFFGANLVKIEEGGWFPIAVGARRSSRLLPPGSAAAARSPRMMQERGAPARPLPRRDGAQAAPPRVPGTAVFLTGNTANGVAGAPPPPEAHQGAARAGHPHLAPHRGGADDPGRRARASVRDLGCGFFQVVARYGFMETPDVPALLRQLARALAPGRAASSSSSRWRRPTSSAARRSSPRARRSMARLAEAALHRDGPERADRERVLRACRPNRVVEMGAQIEL